MKRSKPNKTAKPAGFNKKPVQSASGGTKKPTRVAMTGGGPRKKGYA